MARNVFFFLMIGVFLGVLTGLAIADYGGEVPQSATVEGQMSTGSGFTAIGGVADYWPEDPMSVEPRFAAVGGVADYWPEDPMSVKPRFAAVGGVADYWPEENNTNIAQGRGPVETGALPEMSQDDDNDMPTAEPGSMLNPMGTGTP